MVAAGPSPGRMPTTVPRKQPTKHQKMLAGASATAKPCSRLVAISMSKTQRAGRQRDVERHRESKIERRRDADTGEQRGQQRAAEDDRDDETGQQRDTDREAERLVQCDRNGEGRPGATPPPPAPPSHPASPPPRPLTH